MKKFKLLNFKKTIPLVVAVLFMCIIDSTAAVNTPKESITYGELPQWVFEKQGNGRYVGVSDPDVTLQQGLHQAELRAWMLSQLDTRGHIASIEETFSQTNKGTRRMHFQSLSALKTIETKNVALEISRIHISNYGEIFVEYLNNTTEASVLHYREDPKGEIEIFMSEERGKDTDVIFKNTVSNVFSIQNYKLESTTYIQEQLPENNRFKYRDTKTASSTYERSMSIDGLTTVSRNRTSCGYWSAFIESLVSSLAQYVMINQAYMQETSTEYLNPSDNTTSLSNMQRLHNQEDIRVNLFNASVVDGYLYFDWDKEILSTDE